MSRILNFAVVAMIVAVMARKQIDAAVVNVTQGSTSGYTMTDGNTYVIQDSVTFSNSTAGGSGIIVDDGATVVIFIPTNITLTAIGANGSGQTGGGAGIRVPETATLIITGEGTVNATGGNAGDGGNGANGNKGTKPVGKYYSNGEKYTAKGQSGTGGAGGAGGGGAGAAIGGIGGEGGPSGSGAASLIRSDYTESFGGNGKNGSSGGNGSAGGAMGKVFVIGSVAISLQGGQSGTSGKAGSFASMITIELNSSYATFYFSSCGGGGGGGGGAGNAPGFLLGGGGASGGGGGGGGSGALLKSDGQMQHYHPQVNAHGGGGSGGSSLLSNGASGVAKASSLDGYYIGNTFTRNGGSGGSGGAAGAEGGAGTLYVSPTATVNVDREKLSATTHPAAQYTITFNANGGQFASAVDSLTSTLGCELPDCIPTPTRRGYLFDGWRTMMGEEYYGTSGTKRISSYPVASNVVLYAQWQWDETVDYTVTTPEPVPYSYFDINCPELLAEHGGDYEEAAFATAMNGYNKVWECYVAGISPTNETAKFTAAIEMVDGVPQITWSPNLNTNGVERTYTIWGKANLTDGVEWECPTNSAHRFFKVRVEMP